MAYGTSLWSKFMETEHDDADKMKRLQARFQKTVKSIHVNEYLDLGKGQDVRPFTQKTLGTFVTQNTE
eukprot:1119462-Rhodomonas_salina.1